MGRLLFYGWRPRGNRGKDKSKMHMKAVRITVAGKQYDMYPERFRTN